MSRNTPPQNRSHPPLTAVVAGLSGEIFELPGYLALGMAGDTFIPLTAANTVRLPFGSEIMLLPDRRPVVLNERTGRREVLTKNPFAPGEPVFPVAAFNSPGFVITQAAAYEEEKDARPLPLFSYGALGWHGGSFQSAVLRVDREKRQDLRLMPPAKVTAGIRRMRRQMPQNRLRKHLETCALTYGCPAAKNFFLGRFEAPLPTSEQCNARCLGCISLQPASDIPHCQERIGFTPSPDEIAAVALAHISRVRASVVSFGQGCEGDPLLAADVIEPAIRLIRARTDQGTINMNTNASRPDILPRLFAAGLDSIRVSLNSLREACYNAYFRPRGYSFNDVLESIGLALAAGKFVSVNYLNTPGFTDTEAEWDALEKFLKERPIHLIQWRNLNYDPRQYWRTMAGASPSGPPLGMKNLLQRLKRAFPHLAHGYFNPPRERFGGSLKERSRQEREKGASPQGRKKRNSVT